MAMISSNVALMIMLLSLVGLVTYFGMTILEEVKYLRIEQAFIKTVIDMQKESEDEL